MPGDGIQIFMNMPEMLEGTNEANLWEPGEWGDPQSDGGLGATLPYPGETFGPGGVSGAGDGAVCGGSDWIAMGYPSKRVWKQMGKPCTPYQAITPDSCPPGFYMDQNSGQCLPGGFPGRALPPAINCPPGRVWNPTSFSCDAIASQCQTIPAGQPGSCLSPVSQQQIGTVPGAISTTSGVFSQLEGFFFQHSTLIVGGVILYLLWPTLTKRRR